VGVKIMTLHKDIILGEIAGKNAAIHAYDKIIWMIRSGYLTLLYGGWAIILKGIVDTCEGILQNEYVILVMLSITLSLAIGAYIVDKNYLRRKFRVIYSLNKILEYLFEVDSLDKVDDKIIIKVREHIQVSGDADNRNYDTDGYKQAIRAENAIYAISILSLTAVLIYIFKT
jgi:hypothetical protein